GGWRQIYEAPLILNGARATLSIHGCDEPLEIVKARLNQTKGGSAIHSEASERVAEHGARNENSCRMLIAAGDRFSRLLALAMPNSNQSLIFAFDQSSAEFSKSTPASAESVFPGYSLLPGSRLETIIKNEETGAALETRITDAAPRVIISEISAKLSRQGWKPVCPAGNHGESKHCFMIFQHGESLCTVMAGPALRESKTCVTILLKEKNGQ
ncbi:MAG: hypothetical protein Q7J98_12885, partial [Kiritimatiellia bacterium]|nr:hypothetical protein [Kiritimatiellia bacterium]